MINIILIAVATLIITILLNKKRKTSVIMGLIIILLGIAINTIKKDFTIMQFVYEVICWVLIGISVINNKNFSKIKISLTKKEKVLIFLSIIIGIISLVMCICANNNYILPNNKDGNIGNCYFNADVHRSTSQAIDITKATSDKHPLYRFIMLPILLPIIFINTIANLSSYNIINGYILCIIQIMLNSISTLLIYRLLKHTKIKESFSFMGSILFILSITNVWLSIIPETYSLTLVTMLLMFYCYIKKQKSYIAFAILSLGSNLMCILPIGIIILDLFIKNRKRIKIRTKIIIVILVYILLIISIPVIIYYFNYLYTYSDMGNILEKMQNSLNEILIPQIIGPKFINITPYFVQSNYSNIYSIFIMAILSIIALIGAIYKRKETLTKIGILQIIAGGVLHVIMGYGANNGMIYIPLYSWAFIIFITYGFNFISEKIKEKYIQYIMGTIIFIVALYNCIWVKEFTDNLRMQKCEISTLQMKTGKFDLYCSNGNTESFYLLPKSIIQVSTGKTILKEIDTYTYNEKANNITGVLLNSKWFKLEVINDEIILNVSGRTTKIEKEMFYIFGMGLRDKYILKKNEKYELIEYKTGNTILENLEIDQIDYENYIVYAEDEQKNKIMIYENEDGIYINKNNEMQILQDNVKINIPSFENYEHRYQVKQLFNEIMVNITKDGPKPNFIAYENAWYRDAAIIAMVLEKTNNINQIDEWILSLDKVYDMQNGVEELDNIGQVLYLCSLTEKKNDLLIEKAQREIDKNITQDGYLNGITDNSYHPVYQTKWLIYGLKKLGLNYQKYNIPDIEDFYSKLIWFDEDSIDEDSINEEKDEVYTRWEYIEYASLHYYKRRVNFNSKTYPLSTEYSPSEAKFENMNIINQDYGKSKLIVPHSWSASEMFLYLLDLDEGKIQ